MSMYCLVSKYTVSTNKPDFEELFGRNGEWFKFYESCDDFLGSELLKQDGSDDYLIIDKWMDKSEHKSYIESNSLMFDQLTAKSKEFSDHSEVIGEFDLLQ